VLILLLGIRTQLAQLTSEVGHGSDKVLVGIIDALDYDPDPNVRATAALSLGKAGEAAETRSVIQALLLATVDKNAHVRRSAIEALIEIGPSPVQYPEFAVIARKSLNDEDANVRAAAAFAIAKSDPETAIPTLVATLKDADGDSRSEAARQLGNIKPVTTIAIKPLIASLKDGDAEVRLEVLFALWKMRITSRPAVLAFIDCLKDSDERVRLSAANNIRDSGSSAVEALPALVTALNDDDQETLAHIEGALVAVAKEDQDIRNTRSLPDLKVAQKLLQAKGEKDKSAEVGRVIEFLEAVETGWPQVIARFLTTHTAVLEASLLLLAYAAWFLVVNFVLLKKTPLQILAWSDKLAGFEYKLPSWLGGVNIPLRNMFLIGLYWRHDRVLDAWVRSRVEVYRKRIQADRTFLDRATFVPLPVLVNGETLPELDRRHLRSMCSENRWRILVNGEGGLGKTTLACRIALWSMLGGSEQQLWPKRQMLPIFVEPATGIDALRDLNEFRNALLSRFEHFLGEPRMSLELFCALLESGRILVVLDGLSEFASPVCKLAGLLANNIDLPIAALLVTSRLREGIEADVEISPCRVDKQHLVAFMSAYVGQAGARDIKDAVLFEACQRLARMLDGSLGSTPLLAKMYAEQLVSIYKPGKILEELPQTIPDLMLSYISVLNRHRKQSEPDNPTVHRAAAIAAWHCIKETFRPGPASKAEICQELIGLGLPPGLIEDIEQRLGLIRTILPAETYIHFLLDPLSEYLAALRTVSMIGNCDVEWRTFLCAADAKEGAPDAIHGFLSALSDCTVCNPWKIEIPGFVAVELRNRIA
jgi:HEAT repeat protein